MARHKPQTALFVILIGSTTLSIALGLMQLPTARGQSQVEPRQFEVASIKPSTTAGFNSSIARNPGGRFTSVNNSLRRYVTYAYRIKDYQLTGGPGWIYSEKYDIAAKAAGNPSPDEFRVMLQALLADRFHLKFHRETKELPVYVLVVGKNGPKLQAPSQTDTSFLSSGRGEGSIHGERVSMPELAEALSRLLDRPVLDKTGIEGVFDLRVTYTPVEATAASPADVGVSPPTALEPDLLKAIQEQVGLTLEPQRASIEVIVVDQADRPSEN